MSDPRFVDVSRMLELQTQFIVIPLFCEDRNRLGVGLIKTVDVTAEPAVGDQGQTVKYARCLSPYSMLVLFDGAHLRISFSARQHH